jgi:ribose/xylose/arabinose/galactoside ABC-type transport system permease subunit
MDSASLGKILMLLGGLILLVGVAVYFSDRLPLARSLGRLPGDLSWKGEGWQVHVPLATSILLSVLLTLGFWLWTYFSSRGGK